MKTLKIYSDKELLKMSPSKLVDELKELISIVPKNQLPLELDGCDAYDNFGRSKEVPFSCIWCGNIRKFSVVSIDKRGINCVEYNKFDDKPLCIKYEYLHSMDTKQLIQIYNNTFGTIKNEVYWD